MSREAVKGYLAGVLAEVRPPWELLYVRDLSATQIKIPGVEAGEVRGAGARDPAPLAAAISASRLLELAPRECKGLLLALVSTLALDTLAQRIASGASLDDAIGWLERREDSWKPFLDLVSPVYRDRGLASCSDRRCLYRGLAFAVREGIAECEHSQTASDFALSYIVLKSGLDLTDASEPVYARLAEELALGSSLAGVAESAVQDASSNPEKRLEIEVRALHRIYESSGAHSWLSLSDLISTYSIMLVYLSVMLRRIILGEESWVKRLRESPA